jgi:hypothetical protein
LLLNGNYSKFIIILIQMVQVNYHKEARFVGTGSVNGKCEMD